MLYIKNYIILRLTLHNLPNRTRFDVLAGHAWHQTREVIAKGFTSELVIVTSSSWIKSE